MCRGWGARGENEKSPGYRWTEPFLRRSDRSAGAEPERPDALHLIQQWFYSRKV